MITSILVKITKRNLIASLKFRHNFSKKMSTLHNQNRKIKIALCQITCGENKTDNFNICKNMITEAKRQDAKVNSNLLSF